MFNNRTGDITGVCEIPVDQAVSTLTTSDVESCHNKTVGHLVSGSNPFLTRRQPACAIHGPAPAVERAPEPRTQPVQEPAHGVLVLAPGSDYPVVA